MYQYKLEFKLEKNWLPKEIDRLIVSFLKASAQECSQEFYKRLYENGQSVMKGFTFSYFLPGAKFSKDRIELKNDGFSLFFSDVEQEELLSFFNGFQLMKHKKYSMNGNAMELVSIRMQRLREIKEEEIVVKMQSPLIVRKHNSEDNSDIYFTYGMDGFENALKENIDIFLDRMGLDSETDRFTVQVIKGKKIVVPVFGRNTDAMIGILKLTGSCKLLNILHLSGMGVRRSEGHGKFEVIG